MEFDYSKNVGKIRTKHITTILSVTLCFVALMAESYAVHIDFDDAETSWLKNVAVQVIPANSISDRSVPLLKISGLASTDIEDGVRIKPTLSPLDCIGNQTELQIINSLNKNNINTDLIVSLNNFNFKIYPEAYLCIRTNYENVFQHMGSQSKFKM